jgi:hypothetical protein
VLCCYKILARCAAPERVDVKLASNEIIWGAAADEFEVIDEHPELAHAS